MTYEPGGSAMQMRFRFIAVLLLAISFGSFARASVAEFLVGDSIGGIIGRFRGEMAALIEQAGGETRLTLTHAFQLANVMVDHLEEVYAGSLELTFDELDDAQKKVFSAARDAVNELGAEIEVPANRALSVAESFNAILGTMVPWSNKPLVLAYSPEFIAPAAIGEEVNISVTGVRLHEVGRRAPALHVGDVLVEASEVTDSRLRFVVPRSAFEQLKDKTRFRDASLIIYRRPGGLWSFLPFVPDDEIAFGLLLTVLPDELGTAGVTIVTESKTYDRSPQTYPPLLASGLGAGPHVTAACYYAPKESKFDLSTIVKKKTRHEAIKDNDTSPGTNIGDFIVDPDATEKKICARAVARTGCNECGATTEGHLEVDLLTPRTETKRVNREPISLSWLEDVTVELSKDALRQTVELRLFDGITQVVSLKSETSLPYVQIDPQPSDGVTVIRPRRLWE